MFTEEQYEALTRAAEECDRPPSTWAREVLLAAAGASPLIGQLRKGRAKYRSMKRDVE